MTFLERLRHAWAVLIGRITPTHTIDKDIIMALADDILALSPKFAAAVQAKDSQIASLTAQVADLTAQITAGEQAVSAVSNDIDRGAGTA